jgi:hypothetical protein
MRNAYAMYYICPVETCDGGRVGLVRQLAISASAQRAPAKTPDRKRRRKLPHESHTADVGAARRDTHIVDLPIELCAVIAEYAPPACAQALSITCTRFRSLAPGDSVRAALNEHAMPFRDQYRITARGDVVEVTRCLYDPQSLTHKLALEFQYDPQSSAFGAISHYGINHVTIAAKCTYRVLFDEIEVCAYHKRVCVGCKPSLANRDLTAQVRAIARNLVFDLVAKRYL